MIHLTYRTASSDELSKLNNIIRISKAHWEYTTDFLDNFMEKWGLTKDCLEQNPLTVCETEGNIIGLYGFKRNCNPNISSTTDNIGDTELEYFFIHPNYIGQGYGKILWQNAVEYAQSQNWQQFKLIADPNAQAFYHHMGARTVKLFESFPERYVPIMQYSLATLVAQSSPITSASRKKFTSSNISIRDAIQADLDTLNQLIVRSRTHIGFSVKNNQLFLQNFGLTLDYIGHGVIKVYHVNDKIMGFYGCTVQDNHWHLDYLFVSPEVMGQGLGKLMWDNLCELLRKHECHSFDFIANGYSAAFYQRMGAQRTGYYGNPINNYPTYSVAL